MSKMPIMGRWSVPFAGFLLALMGGVSFAWGVFVPFMVNSFNWTNAEATLPFSVFMAVFALVMIPAGRLQDRIGPRKVALLGTLLFFIAYGLTSLVCRFPHPWWLIITYGVLGGIACGLTYACIAPSARKWFPDKPSLAISFAVMGFGLIAVVLAPFKAEYLIPVHGIGGTFFILGVAVSAVCLFATWLIKDPPDGWQPLGWKSNKETRATAIRWEAAPKEVFRSSTFWIIWPMFMLVHAGGLMCIGLIPSYGELILELTPAEAAIAISIFTAVNGFGRPLAGFLADKFGAVRVMIITYIVQATTFLFFHTFHTLEALYMAMALLGWGFAVTITMLPTIVSICFGARHMGVNIGLVFSAFAVSAFAPLAGARIFDITGSYVPAFIAAGIMAGISLVLCIVLKKKYGLA
ncbi:OFA family MFS transporter [candidate division NPL-UPA2 bacterium]|nr:OFA family MFS transporter [candidate division NPL-UPA2 bacterium]